MSRVLYAELTPRQFRQRMAAAPIAYLPLGTLEWHGEHMPLGADGLQSQGFFVELARKAGGIVLPMLFLGPDVSEEHEGRPYYGMDNYSFPGEPPQQLEGSAYWVDYDFFERLLERIMAQLKRAGFKIVVAHGHAPSVTSFVGKTQQWEQEFGLKTFICWRGDESDGMGIQTDHGGANETMLVMALRGELVEMDNLDPDLAVKPLGTGGEDSRTGASPERGRQAIEMNVERMAGLLKEALAEINA
ncbi:MAG: creatininase family protein [Nitrospiraceae bacterium]|nr:creatininase family protein [Nitrospiraceae bacterium]